MIPAYYRGAPGASARPALGRPSWRSCAIWN